MSDSRIWELLARKYNNEISEEELSELARLLQQPGEALHLNELLADLQALPLQSIASEAEEAKSLDALQLLVKVDNTAVLFKSTMELSKRAKRRKGLYAAGATAFLVMMVFARFALNTGKPPTSLSVPLNEVVTSGGSKSTIHLPDGSSVILNTGSKLSYNKDFGVGTREIYLSGEAFFDIAKNEKVPLTVHAGDVDISVKGTVFNVKAYQEDSMVEASLIRGAIEVFSKSDRERRILLRPNEKIIIGKIAHVRSSEKNIPLPPEKEEVFVLGKIKTNPSDSSISEIAWIQNKLAFYKEPFSSLAQKMESWYNVSIQFNDERLEKFTFTGSFEKEDIIEALDALRQITPFEYRLENRNVIIGKAGRH
ncbi:FecR family protein [Agriterribacter sp.]|uniref:FecR family protein n=1 Tax=Agriterribacter sp. TaxID=2821509 RepID=UPI002BD42F40|nr:FecR family protein [Agriterribacter sp.]HTN05914.1 FecR family protein [Agriterribacter sp.]